MHLIIPLIFVLGINVDMVLVFRRKFGTVLPISLLSAALVVSIFGFFGWLKIGVAVVFALGMLGYPALLLLALLKKGRLKSFIGEYFSLGFFVFMVIYVFLFLTDYARKIQNWDEIVYWGLRVKEMMRIDQLYTSSDSLLTFHQDYPPFTACFQYLWCQMSGGFRDGWLYMSMHLMELSLIMPCIEYFHMKKRRENIAVIFMVFMFCVAAGLFVDLENDAMMFKTIYIDAFMAILAAYGFFFVFMVKEVDAFYVVNLGLVGSGLLLSKQSGLGFFIIMLIILVVNRCMLNWDASDGSLHGFIRNINAKKIALVSVLSIAVPYVFYRVWERYVARLGLTRQFDPENNRSVVKLVKILMGGGEDYQRTTVINYIQALLENTLMKRPLPMAYWQLVLVTIVLFEIVAYISRNQIPRKYVRMLNVISVVGAVIYAGFMMMLYVFSFNEAEATSLASFRRYLNTYWMIIWVFAGLIIIATVAQSAGCFKELRVLWILLAVLWIVVIDPSEVRKIYPTAPSVSTSVLADNVSNGKSVYILDTDEDNDPGYTRSFIRYRLWPASVDGGIYGDLDELETKEEFLDIISKYDYLYVASGDEEFFEKFALPLETNGIYQITSDETGIAFNLVGKE